MTSVTPLPFHHSAPFLHGPLRVGEPCSPRRPMPPSHLSVSVFASLRDNDPLSGELTWPQDLNEWREVSDKADAPLWSPVTYREGGQRVLHQTEANIALCHALVLDYDNEGEELVTVARAHEVWAGWEHAIYTTASHLFVNPPKYTGKPRFRVVLPLSRPVTTQEFRRVWQWAHAFATGEGAPFDPLADPGRIYFVPTHRAGQAPEYLYNPAEELLNPDEIFSVFTGSVPEPRRTGVFSASSARPALASPSSGGQRSPGGVFSGIENAHQTEHLDRIEAQCAFMRHCREDAATLPQPEWYAWLSILARCREAEQHAQEVGSAHPGYSREETADTLQRALTSSGPRTCANIRTLSSACTGCPHTITSPVQLGRPDPVTATPEALRDDAQRRTDVSLAAAERGLLSAEAEAARLAIVEAETRALAMNLRQFGHGDAVREAAATHAQARQQLTDARSGVRDARDALRAAQATARRNTVLGQADPRIVQGLFLDVRSGLPRSSLANVEAILQGDARYADRFFRYDEFSGKLFYGPDLAADHIDTDINIDIERRYSFSSRTTLVQEAILKVAKQNGFHPVREYLDSLVWDGASRLSDLLSAGFGAVGERVFLAEAGAKFAIGAVARIFDPGCQMDNMLVLTGHQGVGKSTGLRTLSNGWFADSPLPLGDKDSYLQLGGRWFYEISELDSFRKAENTRIKAFISSRFDSFRPPFGRHVVERPRQTILVGTTNEDQFLNDPTGSRRFVPVRVTKVNLPWLAEFRDQVWAEAVVRFRAGEMWWYDGESAARLSRESRPYQQEDPWEQPVLDFLRRRRLPTITVLDVLTGCIGVSLPNITRQERSRITQLLRMFGCEEVPVADGTESRVVWAIPREVYLAEPAKKAPSAQPFRWATPKAEA